MAGRIPQRFIDDLLNRVDIIDVIHSRVPLKKAGREFTACCPFHHEKTPSFTVSPNKQFYHCFGCGAHGTAITFLMEYEHQEFVEAIETLAANIGVDVPREQTGGPEKTSEQKAQQQSLYDILELARKFYQQQLRQAPQAIEYLKARGLSGEIAKTFRLGYSPDSWDALQKSLNIPNPTLLESGLATQNEQGRVYDRFRGRVMFPIRDRQGRTIAFGGRILGDGNPKYLNSPETPTFHKGQELYGLFEARQLTRKLERLLVVEGYMDVIALHQHGISDVVATLGTATTAQHVERIFRLVPTLIFCFDGDRAGREAAWKALETALPLLRDDKSVAFLFLPDGEDPDSLVQQEGKAAFEERLAQATPLSLYFFDRLNERFSLGSLEGKAAFTRAALRHLREMPDSLLRDQMLKKLAHWSDESEAKLKQAVLNAEAEKQLSATREQPQIKITPMRMAIALLVQNPELAQLVDDAGELSALKLRGGDLFIELLATLQTYPDISTPALLERWRNCAEGDYLLKLMDWQIPIPDDQTLKQSFKDTIQRLWQQHREQRLAALIDKSRSSFQELNSEEKRELNRLLQQNHQSSL